MEKLLNYAEAAAILNVKVDTLQRWSAARKIDRVKMPSGGVRFTEKILREFLEKHHQEATPEPTQRQAIRNARSRPRGVFHSA